MLLAVDIGNTNIVVGVFQDDRLLTSWRMESDRARMADEWWALLSTLAASDGIDLRAVDGAIIASGVPQLATTFRTLIRRRLHREPIEVSAALDLGIRVCTDNPMEVGADRLANAVAAHHRGPGPWVVVDFGTATTLDIVSPAGDYLGGAIAPGVLVALEALTARAARLQAVDLVLPERAIGRNTRQAIQSGTLLGYLGLIEGLLARVTAELGQTPNVVVTGGLGELFVRHSPALADYDPDLTLIGLALIYRRLVAQRGAA
ncbi:MAG: type III pantothenate kinase [Sphaerobacter sp.]|nr:type III pantothenate kinase [Sphaerobacter sp.]